MSQVVSEEMQRKVCNRSRRDVVLETVRVALGTIRQDHPDRYKHVSDVVERMVRPVSTMRRTLSCFLIAYAPWLACSADAGAGCCVCCCARALAHAVCG